ncbi:SLC2A3 [Symbiodinium sp. CCMP2592]|nr:SLC2A3 [Symbiodinium sp. CCMP2592]
MCRPDAQPTLLHSSGNDGVTSQSSVHVAHERFAATNGPLSVVAICGSQSTLLSFDVDETAGHLLDGLDSGEAGGSMTGLNVEAVETSDAVSFAGHWCQEGLAGGEAETDLTSAGFCLANIRNSIAGCVDFSFLPAAMRFGSATRAVVNGAKARVVGSLCTKAVLAGAGADAELGPAEAVDEVEVLEEACEAAELAQLTMVLTDFTRALELLRVVRGDEVSAYSQSSVRAFLRQTKGQLEAEDHYNRKAQAFELGSAEDARAVGFYFVSYAWEPPSGLDARRGVTEGETPFLPSIEQQQGRPEIFADARDWYAQAQAKSLYLECRGQRELHPRDLRFWIERASLPQSGPIFELARSQSFFLLEYILLSKAMIAVASPHYFSRGWCLFEFASKLATAPDSDPAALGIAWKAFVSFGSRKDGFPVSLYADVIRFISIETAEFSVATDREILLSHVDKLFVSREAFDRFAKFVALARLGRSCYTREDRRPFALVALEEGFEELGDLLAAEALFDARKSPDALQSCDEALRPLFAKERRQAVRIHTVESLQLLAMQARHVQTRALGGGWRRALRCAIQEFKWGDYTTKPNTRYRYTLCAIHGDPQIGIDSSPSGGPAKRGPGLHVAAQVELEVVIPAADGDHQVFFNRGVAGSQRFARLSTGTRESGPRSWEQWQWLSNGLEEALLSFIGRAHKGFELRCAFYEAHYPPVMRALAAAERRGASVQIVMDWKIASWSDDKKVWSQRGPQHLNYWALAESGLLNSGRVFHRTRPLAAISHNKFIILTAPDGALSVWTGSTNITAGAIFGHSNVGHIVARPALCKKYMAYWERLTRDPEKKDLAQFNEQLSPLPEEESKWTELVLFSPRLRWADALSFMAQLILKARHSVAFTAAFGISREISPALLAAGSEGAGMPVPTYLLLESQGNWQASRDAVQALQRKSNVRVAFGMHMEVPPGKPQPQGGAWIPETLTGLNEHAAAQGSDAYSVEFFRIFEHMRFRNHVQGIDKRVEVEPPGPQAEALDEVMCRCGQAVQHPVLLIT